VKPKLESGEASLAQATDRLRVKVDEDREGVNRRIPDTSYPPVRLAAAYPGGRGRAGARDSRVRCISLKLAPIASHGPYSNALCRGAMVDF
jgi:hypothetical protein